MRDTGFRKHITEGLATLPVTALAGAALWLLPDLKNPSLWCTLAVVTFMTYVVIETNNRYRLIRVRSRMNSVVFLSLFTAFPALHDDALALMPAAAVLFALFVLFRAYGSTRTQSHLFLTFLLLGSAALVFPPLLLFVPFVLFTAQVQLRVLTPAAVGGALLGLTLPYWFYAAAVLPTVDFDLTELPARLWALMPALPHPERFGVSWNGILPFAAVLVPGLGGTLHYFRTSYNDKISTRQYLYTLTVWQIPGVLLAVLYPECAGTVLPLLIALYAPLVGHHLTLARGRAADVWMVCCVLALLALTVSNYRLRYFTV